MIELPDLGWDVPPPSRCGRTTKSGRPCQHPRMPQPYPNPSRWQSPACKRHASLEELRDQEAAFQATEAAISDHQATLPVACWSWPVTEEHRARAEAARAAIERDGNDDLAWDLLADWQDDRCAICKSRHGDVLDHDHRTALVRGWLCRSCNLKEGHASGATHPVVRYRTRNPATILGLEIVYRSSWGVAVPEALPRNDRSET